MDHRGKYSISISGSPHPLKNVIGTGHDFSKVW
ncbi:MAG: hypothetical protein JWP63_1909 [Candidatus Solibacter sp.]|nr:hypothetical protein [Candidatus Solibacter sp.]